jgi:hypothetical protein
MEGTRGGRHRASRAAVVALVLSGQCAMASTNSSSPIVSPAVVAAVAHGRARVLVELRAGAGFQAEGDLHDGDAISAQRSGIAASQQAVIAGLQGTDAIVLQQYTSVPFLALEIGPSALRAIENMTEVVRVVEDSLNVPSVGPAR